jgi:neprilysin
MNGEVTKTEDTADNGGVNLAYRAYKNFIAKSQEKQQNLIALEYSPEKLFWISYAQFYCSVQRFELKKSLFEDKEVHSFDRFRVLGPLQNSRDFAHDFQCGSLSKMNPDRNRCKVW